MDHEDNRYFPGPICHLPLCKAGCQIIKDPNQPCPKCVCDKNTTSEYLLLLFLIKAMIIINQTLIITFFYISRRKYWFRANFRFPVFDGFTRFGMS